MNLTRNSLVALVATLSFPSHAQEANLETVVVTAEKPLPAATPVSRQELPALRATTSDTANLLRDTPGVSLYGAGGVSSLPAIHGLADDRLRIKVDGMDLIASCPNHMNPALSYIDPTNVGALKVYAGISPVSQGGDSIGGSIVAESAAPKFAAPGQGSLLEGEVGAFYRSNGNGRGANLSATYATESLSISYAGATAKSDNYKAGGDYKNFTVTPTVNAANIYHPTDAPAVRNVPANEVGSTAFETRNHTIGVAFKGDRHLVEAKIGIQDLPYQLYPNQRMDMLDNQERRLNLRYLGQFGWGALEARAYHETVSHFMDFGPDKLYNYGALVNNTYPVNGMPMYTKGKTDGVSAKADIELNPRDLVRIGADWQAYRLDDWWPPAPNCGYTGAVANCTGGMAPNTFWNIRDGKRARLGIYGEWEAAWNPEWKSLMGVRYERVESNAGGVQGYNATTAMYTGSSVGTLVQWNALDRKRIDNNVDLTLLARNTPDNRRTFEYGFAQKTRSPNLYERYSWSTNAMALEMNNFVGDGNGYFGNPDLKPEVARTLSITGDWYSEDREYEFKVTPYYTDVKDFIDVVRRPTVVSFGVSDQNATRTTGFVKLQYANQSAHLYGIDISGKMPLGKTDFGAFGLKGLLNYTRGKNTDTHDDLYNIMPLNAKLTLTQKSGGWDNGIELAMVKSKSDVSDARNEIKTPGYSLWNLRGSYSMRKVRFDFGVENLFDRKYYLPLGGAYTGEGATMSLNNEAGNIRYATVSSGSYGVSGSASMWGTAVPGPGRSLYAAVSYKF